MMLGHRPCGFVGFCSDRGSASPVSTDYGGEEGAFTGTVNCVQVDLGEDAHDADHFIGPTSGSASA
jgi:hypothetical protein